MGFRSKTSLFNILRLKQVPDCDKNITSGKIRIELSTEGLPASQPTDSSDAFFITVLLSKDVRERITLPLSPKD